MVPDVINATAKKIKTKCRMYFKPEQIWVRKDIYYHPHTLQILEKLGDVPINVIDSAEVLKKHTDMTKAKKQIFISSHQGEPFKPCQGICDGSVCCRYHTIDLISGCPMDCSYCILQSYLANNPITTIHINLEEIFNKISTFLDANSKNFYRIGTGELSDSLAYDDITDFGKLLILFFSQKTNALLELKTKTNMIEHLLDLPHKNRTVLSWSLNIPEIIKTEEIDTASLEDRLLCAKRAVEAGYKVGFHIDPIVIIHADKAETDAYKKLLNKIFDYVCPDNIAWISLGMLRFPPDLKTVATKRFPDSRIFTGELVPTNGKMRYLRFIREEVTLSLWKHASSLISANKLYLCMETPQIWKKIDPTIQNNTSLEKRLTHTESVIFDYKIS